MSDPFRAAKSLLIVVKVGSTLLVDAESGSLRRAWLKRLCGDVATLGHEGHAVIVVSC